MDWEPAVFALPGGEWTPPLVAAMQACDDPMWVFDVERYRMPWANQRALDFWNAKSVAELAERDFSNGMSQSTRLRLAGYQRTLERDDSVFDRWTLFPGDRPQTMLIAFGRVPGQRGVEQMLLRARHCETTQSDIRGVEALRHTSVMITLCTPRGHVLMQNPAAAEAFGDLSMDVGNDAMRQRFVSAADAELVENALLEEGEFRGELSVRTDSGEVWHALHVLTTSDPATGQPAILVNETNIDGRKRSELALAEASEKLEQRVVARTLELAEQRAFVEGILDTSPCFMFVADAGGGVVRGNRALRDWLGQDPVVEKCPAWRLLSDCTPEMYWEWIRSAPPSELEVESRSGSKERSVVYWTLQVFEVDDNRFLVGAGLDITERREMQMRAQTNDRMVALGTLASGVAHEINNPLAYVLTNVELAQARAQTGDVAAVQEHLEAAAGACVRAAKIVADLKGFSRPPGPTTSVNLLAVVDSARRMMSHLLVERQMFACTVPGDVWVRGDETKLCQVVLNLLVNAAEACEGRGAEASVEVSVDRDGDEVTVVVDDTGAGMSEAVRARIFDPFFTTKGRRQGTGLGLAISHRIVDQLGGAIEVESREGHGSTFRVRLPGGAPPNEQAPAEAPTHAVGRRRVLIVDDEPGLAEGFALSLSRHDTMTATSGVEALACIDAADFDVVVCDMSMPEMDGPSLHAALMKKDPDLASRMLFVTGGAFTPQAHEFLREMSGRVLYKPVGTDALRKFIGDLVAERGPR
ncbi:MAG: hybrid sensor histidine kinase/response regulator [Nannocystales bacterium]